MPRFCPYKRQYRPNRLARVAVRLPQQPCKRVIVLCRNLC